MFLFIVLVGLVNAIPGIPGLDRAVQTVSGLDWLTVRKFATEWVYPLAFTAMTVCVALKHSMWVSWADRSTLRR